MWFLVTLTKGVCIRYDVHILGWLQEFRDTLQSFIDEVGVPESNPDDSAQKDPSVPQLFVDNVCGFEFCAKCDIVGKKTNVDLTVGFLSCSPF